MLKTLALELNRILRASRIGIIALVLCALFIIPNRIIGMVQKTSITNVSLFSEDVALIKEVFYLHTQLGRRIWPGWIQSKAPFLYKTKNYDFLINHPNPPHDYWKYYDIDLGDTVWVKENIDSTDYQATYPINGIFTAVMTKQDADYDACLWVLKATHELFHVYQHKKNRNRVVNPFVGNHANKHELSYPFPYNDGTVKSFMRIEAEHVFRIITSDKVADIEAKMTKKVLSHLLNIGLVVFTDSLDFKYKQWMEWNEGVARYTERELAALAANTTLYKPLAIFNEKFPESTYSKVWKSYANSLNPVRFVGEGVKGRVMFYYLGMGKAYLLDRLYPVWKHNYFEHDLDYLISSETR
jgi:hypothetical protein